MSKAKSPAEQAMGLGLKALNNFAGLKATERLGLHKPTERLLYGGASAGFAVAGRIGRSFAAVQKILSPQRMAAAERAPMFDLTPSDEQLLLQSSTLRFALEQLRPAALAADSACKAPAELLAAAADLGFAQWGIPAELGGGGAERSAVSNVLITEALAQGDLGLTVACLAPAAVATAITLYGNAAQQSAYLPAFSGAHPPLAALAIQEPQALFDPLAQKTQAYRHGYGFILNGAKALVPHAAECELLIVSAMLEGEPQLFVVESKAVGLTVAPEPAMGLRAAATGRITFDKVALPASALLGDVDDFCEVLNLSRIAWAALATGTGRAVLNEIIPYSNNRIAFGEPISHKQAVAFMVADSAIELEGLRLCTWRAASLAERGEDCTQAAAIARKMAADAGMFIGNHGIQVLGGHGFTKEYPVERWYRDLRACAFMEGVVLV